MSPSAPAGSPTMKSGIVTAAWTRAISRALAPRSPISHCVPTVCIHVPTLEASWAIQSARYSG
jgi:hypothetical protein